MRSWVLGVALATHILAQTPSDVSAGRKIFESQCALCHGQSGHSHGQAAAQELAARVLLVWPRRDSDTASP